MAVSFNSSVDIANRALQHCGQTTIDATLGFSEDSKQAFHTSFVYDKLRRAELRQNAWKFAIRETLLRAVSPTTAQVNPLLWQPGTSYGFGELVSDVTGSVWSSNSTNNVNNQPGVGSHFEPYCGALTADAYVSTTSYSAGELVYVPGTSVAPTVYRSLINVNADNPATINTWSATVVYRTSQVVTYLSVNYQSLIDFNTGNTPSAAPALWASGTTYAIGNQVGASDGFIYTSTANGNIGNDPTTDLTGKWTNTHLLNPWTTVITSGTGSYNWMPIQAVLDPLPILYPINAGPSTQNTTGNVFWLPGNFLRRAPQNPKAGMISWLGAPGNIASDDYNLEAKFIVSDSAGPIVLRFVTDVTNITLMDDLFCEGLAASIALAVCEPLTQDTTKINTIHGIYKEVMGKAKLQNAIEAGSTELPLDDYLACRL